MSSFDRGTVQLIVERATTYIPRSRRAAVGARECITLALVWFRSGSNVRMIASHIGLEYQQCLGGLHCGIKAIAKCFESFEAYGGTDVKDISRGR